MINIKELIEAPSKLNAETLLELASLFSHSKLFSSGTTALHLQSL